MTWKKKKDEKIVLFGNSDLGPCMTVQQVRQIPISFSEKFQKAGLEPVEDELRLLEGLNVDAFNCERRDGTIAAECRLEEERMKSVLLDQLHTLQDLLGEEFAELIDVMEMNSELREMEKMLLKEIAELETRRKCDERKEYC